MNGVVVVPEHAAGFRVGIVVILELPGLGGVLGPAVEGTPGGRAMEMDRVRALRIVDEPHHGLGPPGDDEAGTGRDPVVPNQLSSPE